MAAPKKPKLRKLRQQTITTLFLGWRRHRVLDVYGHIEEELPMDEASTVEAFIEWLKENPGKKTGRDYLDATLAEFYAAKGIKR